MQNCFIFTEFYIYKRISVDNTIIRQYNVKEASKMDIPKYNKTERIFVQI